jgi:hypothetical protein
MEFILALISVSAPMLSLQYHTIDLVVMLDMNDNLNRFSLLILPYHFSLPGVCST